MSKLLISVQNKIINFKSFKVAATCPFMFGIVFFENQIKFIIFIKLVILQDPMNI